MNAGIDVGLPYCEAAPEMGYWERCSKLNGESCGGGTECVSASCADGVCCDSACSAACMACDLVTSVGECKPIPAGNDPDGDCSTGETCDGAGACKKLEGERCGLGVECLTGRCSHDVCCGGDLPCTEGTDGDGGPDRGIVSTSDSALADGPATGILDGPGSRRVDGAATARDETAQDGCSCQLGGEHTTLSIVLTIWAMLVVALRRRRK